MTSKMEKNRKTGFLEWNNSILLDSFKNIDLGIIFIIILDAAFYLLATLSYFLWDRFMKAKAAAISLPSDPNELVNLISSLGPEKSQLIASQVKSYFFMLVFSFILLILLIIFLASIFKSLIWATIAKTRITLKFISSFLLLNLIWMGFWVLMIFLISYLMQPASVPIFLIISFVLSIYFTNIIYPHFLQSHKIGTLGRSLKLGIAKFRLFILPAILVFLNFFILLWLTGKLRFDYGFLVGNLVLITYAAWVRYYAYELVTGIEKR